MHDGFSGSFPNFTILFANLKLRNWWVLFSHYTFLVHKLEIFKNCKEAKHMIIAIIYIFLSYMFLSMFYLICFLFFYLISFYLKLLSENPQPSLKKITPPFYSLPHLKSAIPPHFCQHWEFFSSLPPPPQPFKF